MTTTSPRPAARLRPGCGPPTWPPWPASGCGPASCAPGCPRWASRSASRRSSPSWAWPPPPPAALLAEIQALGTNLLTVTNGQTFSGETAELPVAAPGMIARLPGVTAVQDTGTVGGVSVYKSPLIPPIETNAPQRRAPPPWACPRWPAPASRRAGS